MSDVEIQLFLVPLKRFQHSGIKYKDNSLFIGFKINGFLYSHWILNFHKYINSFIVIMIFYWLPFLEFFHPLCSDFFNLVFFLFFVSLNCFVDFTWNGLNLFEVIEVIEPKYLCTAVTHITWIWVFCLRDKWRSLFSDPVSLLGSSPSGCPPSAHVGSFQTSRLFFTADVDGSSPKSLPNAPFILSKVLLYLKL